MSSFCSKVINKKVDFSILCLGRGLFGRFLKMDPKMSSGLTTTSLIKSCLYRKNSLIEIPDLVEKTRVIEVKFGRRMYAKPSKTAARIIKYSPCTWYDVSLWFPPLSACHLLHYPLNSYQDADDIFERPINYSSITVSPSHSVPLGFLIEVAVTQQLKAGISSTIYRDPIDAWIKIAYLA